MTSVGSGSAEVGWLNDSDGIVGSTLHFVMTPPHCPAVSVDCGPLEVSSPVLLETTSDMGNESDEIIIGNILPMPTSIFILEWLPVMLNDKALCLYQKSKKKTTTRERRIYLRKVCLS
jgi:hypothetical protein